MNTGGGGEGSGGGSYFISWPLAQSPAPLLSDFPQILCGEAVGAGKKAQPGSATPDICPASCKAFTSPRLSFLIYQMGLLIFVWKDW